MTPLASVLGLLLAASAQEPTPAPPALPVVPEEIALAPYEAAYQKEFAYLSTEREGLEARVASQADAGRAARADAEAELDRLEARLVALQVRREQAQALLEDVDRAAQTALEADDALEAALFQARTSLETDGFELPATAREGLDGKADDFRSAFAEGSARIAQGGQVRWVDGAFFGPDGTRLEGELALVGNVATFGRAGAEAYALVPVGEGHLHAWREGGGATGTALADGRAEPAMGIYLHEGRTKRIEERAEKSLGDVLAAGGVVGYVILVLGAGAFVLILLRIVLLLRAARGAREVDEALVALAQGEVAQARALVGGGAGSAPRVVRDLLEVPAHGHAALEDVANAALLREQPLVERFGAAILVIAAVAPLLGLLGTVTGMIATFDIITEYGTGDPRMLSGGISEALVTTQFGLVVAIPSLLGGNLLAGWGEVVLARAETAALRVLTALGSGEGDDDATPDRLAAASK
ncbi:MAG: MotA/TolQ/ExbB proton channel family protein [Alphaproteobacteria bacterium]|nr:MotA/TolQ/ExbB proton channel family protein [Alphaproteobacteria bacterium]